MKVVGVIAVGEDNQGEPLVVCVNPERAYLVVPPDGCPDNWHDIMHQVQSRDGFSVLGVLIDAGKMEGEDVKEGHG